MKKRKTKKKEQPKEKSKRIKNLNIDAIQLGVKKYIRQHPLYSAMYRHELLAEDLEEARRRNKRR